MRSEEEVIEELVSDFHQLQELHPDTYGEMQVNKIWTGRADANAGHLHAKIYDITFDRVGVWIHVRQLFYEKDFRPDLLAVHIANFIYAYDYLGDNSTVHVANLFSILPENVYSIKKRKGGL